MRGFEREAIKFSPKIVIPIQLGAMACLEELHRTTQDYTCRSHDCARQAHLCMYRHVYMPDSAFRRSCSPFRTTQFVVCVPHPHGEGRTQHYICIHEVDRTRLNQRSFSYDVQR